MRLGYCCNVHPGVTLSEVQRNLQEYSLKVKQLVAHDRPMGIGLWLSATAATELENPKSLQNFRDWVNQSQLIPFTLNGFPFGNFHSSVVKHDVYVPTWADSARLDYTIRLATILTQLLPPGQSGTISTLPLGWPHNHDQRQIQLAQCGDNLRLAAKKLSQLEDTTGHRICLCIEPEPGCWLDSPEDVIYFFNNYLFSGSSRDVEIHRRYLQVCHDICHSAVMFESQRETIEKYAIAGIEIGKLQVSSALSIDFDRLSIDEKENVLQQLQQFAEPKYLHQTVWQRDGKTEFFEDLPLAIDAVRRDDGQQHLKGTWRVHFHVPIFAESLGLMGTTQNDIQDCLDQMQTCGSIPDHIEIETYAWNVLPQPWQPESLAQGIAEEWRWFERLFWGNIV